MCGILGIAATVGGAPSLREHELVRLRDGLAHRGPDAAGVYSFRNVILAHRRLAVIDPTSAGAQPMGLTEGGALCRAGDAGVPRFVLVYNGELYNDAEIRREIAEAGVRFETSSDTETVLRALSLWGLEGLRRLRGMFALAFHDARLNLLTLARDALGVKPLYYALGAREIMFASEPGPLLRHPDVSATPNMRMVSAYLTTIRTTLGGETLFERVHALSPGHALLCDLDRGEGGVPLVRSAAWWRGPRIDERADAVDARVRVREAVSESVHRHLRSDVPTCALLSGGLDSTIITSQACRAMAGLRTFAAGAPVPLVCAAPGAGDDLSEARSVARVLGTIHAEAHVTRDVFTDRFPWMVRRMGAPLSTPNEVAIHEVARRLRQDGCIVTLSGEGADELFGGYDASLDAAWGFVSANPGAGPHDAARFELGAGAWTPIDFKQGLLNEDAWRSAEEDRWLIDAYAAEFAASIEECGGYGIEAHGRVLRRVNLAGLLQRLDSATMLASVEGRTPFADAEVAWLAESLPMRLKYLPPGAAPADESVPGREALATLPRVKQRTKMVLREAFADAVPDFVLERAKASFPLPFQAWLPDHVEVLRRSPLARACFSEAAIGAVAMQPERMWRLAWPMINIAHWGEAMGW